MKPSYTQHRAKVILDEARVIATDNWKLHHPREALTSLVSRSIERDAVQIAKRLRSTYAADGMEQSRIKEFLRGTDSKEEQPDLVQPDLVIDDTKAVVVVDHATKAVVVDHATPDMLAQMGHAQGIQAEFTKAYRLRYVVMPNAKTVNVYSTEHHNLVYVSKLYYSKDGQPFFLTTELGLDTAYNVTHFILLDKNGAATCKGIRSGDVSSREAVNESKRCLPYFNFATTKFK